MLAYIFKMKYLDRIEGWNSYRQLDVINERQNRYYIRLNP